MTASTERVATVVIDPFRRDRVGAVTGGKALTPNVDALARDGTVFENAFSATNGTDRSIPVVERFDK
jgi:arylsulfatase A-like enzyme